MLINGIIFGMFVMIEVSIIGVFVFVNAVI